MQNHMERQPLVREGARQRAPNAASSAAQQSDQKLDGCEDEWVARAQRVAP